ncbi:hypothetical protein HHK36_017932 [Tetracentron sinense]|uniref:DRBM domain-containing protein n=1 Tax=Tetracentron sinense TaxID=13715 RepID=A0A835DD16_TETSI|nr:hypothetical protein HHK36_017932 [Tetracentron sinense]
MFKSRLQELCQKKSWNIPTYSPSKDGPDHNPRFKASVTVNGVSFETPNFCKSSKDAQNDAAKLAFDHFTSPQPFFPSNRPLIGASSPSPSPSPSPGSSSASTELNSAPNSGSSLLPKIQEKCQSSQIHLNEKEFGDMQYVHKSQLQYYAQKRNLNPPVYSRQLEGQPHAPRFKAKVTVDGQTFEGPTFFSTLREAEHAAAKAALMSLSLDDIQEATDNSGFYKNLLQELAQKEGFSLPTYNTNRSGPSHLPTFSSTVEVEGEFFHGKEAKTKKQAEIDAAKVAYTGLKQRKSLVLYFNDTSQAEEAFECTPPKLIVTDDLQQNLRPKSPWVLTSSIRSEEHAEESRAGDLDADSTEVISAKPDNDTGRNEDMRSSSDKVYARLRDPFLSVPSSPEDGPSSPTKPSVCFAPSVVDSNIELSTGMRSSLLCTRVRVYPRTPDMKLPKGVTMLPISDDKWVAMSLDSPSQEGN